MKIKLCHGLWLVSLDKSLMRTENRVPSVSPPEYTAGGLEDLPKAREGSYLKSIYSALVNSFKELDPLPHCFEKVVWLI